MGRQARLAAEIPDIFIPLSRNENSGMTIGGILLRLDWEPLREHVLTTGEHVKEPLL